MILSETHAWGSFAVPGQKRLIELKRISVVSEKIEFL